MRHIFIIGSKGIPAAYGGFESFVDKLTQYRMSGSIQYHVACIGTKKKEVVYNNARCFYVPVPNIGSAKAIYYDLKAFKICLNYIKTNNISYPIIYILACRIGPFLPYLKKKTEKLNGKIFVNPDGHEWLRAKWNCLIKRYWRFSERLMVKHADLLICDSKTIEQYIKQAYKLYCPKTTFIAYGADVSKAMPTNSSLKVWFKNHKVTPKNYYLIVGRFVPENNFKTIIQGYMQSKTSKALVIISNIEKNKFYRQLKEKTNFDKDPRIKFVGTVYDVELLKMIRENAYGYIHGHSVGGTNPSLLEALASTNLNLLYDVGFNREVASNAAWYWNDSLSLRDLIDRADELSKDIIWKMGKLSKMRIEGLYNWPSIIERYEKIFLDSCV